MTTSKMLMTRYCIYTNSVCLKLVHFTKFISWINTEAGKNTSNWRRLRQNNINKIETQKLTTLNLQFVKWKRLCTLCSFSPRTRFSFFLHFQILICFYLFYLFRYFCYRPTIKEAIYKCTFNMCCLFLGNPNVWFYLYIILFVGNRRCCGTLRALHCYCCCTLV